MGKTAECPQCPWQGIPYQKDNRAHSRGRKSHIRMRTELNALESPISKCKQNLRNSSTPSENPLDQPIKKPSCNPLRGPSPCSTVSGILGPKLELANKPSCACIGVGSLVVSRIRNLGHNTGTRGTKEQITFEHRPTWFRQPWGAFFVVFKARSVTGGNSGPTPAHLLSAVCHVLPGPVKESPVFSLEF